MVSPQCFHIYRLCPPVWLPCASLVLLHWLKTCPYYLYIHGIYSSLFWIVFCKSFLLRKMCGRIKIRSNNLWNFSLQKLEANSLFVVWDFSRTDLMWIWWTGHQHPGFLFSWEVILPCYKQLQGGFPWLRMEVSSYQWGKWVVCLQWSKGVWCFDQHFTYNLLKYPKAAIISGVSPYKLSKCTAKGRHGVGFYTTVS